MSNPCCCDGGYNKSDNCLNCDLGSHSQYTITSEITGFTDNYACSVATHVNRTVVHSVNFGPFYGMPADCCDTLIAGNASAPEPCCQSLCPPDQLGYVQKVDPELGCPPDIDIGANPNPACVNNAEPPNYTATRAEARCWEPCDYLKQCSSFGDSTYFGYRCYLTIWFSICIKADPASPSESIIEYVITHPVLDVSRITRHVSTPCDGDRDAANRCDGWWGRPFIEFAHYSGYVKYNSDQLCSSIGPINITPCFHYYSFMYMRGQRSEYCDVYRDEPEDFNCKDLVEMCGTPLDSSGANIRLTLNLS